ncbi:hypothetical protein STCU_03383 [Strigomonas culicis]|uniref:Uncharacterized protein n=1 Tax=Strigomonas culicis TaxID=28005 RepID=S9UL71_9TRYP|nr:hypothetical protein STCU_03383 [Strigomonas culicis]|eukprot:EPY31582.1 hypothetical protein STCU_03383 [Strigomonas culicis]
MDKEKFHLEYPVSFRCESSDTIVFVACPRGGRYGDVRKTLAGLLQCPFGTINIAPTEADASGAQRVNTTAIPFKDADLVPEQLYGTIVEAHILHLNSDGLWVRC